MTKRRKATNKWTKANIIHDRWIKGDVLRHKVTGSMVVFKEWENEFSLFHGILLVDVEDNLHQDVILYTDKFERVPLNEAEDFIASLEKTHHFRLNHKTLQLEWPLQEGDIFVVNDSPDIFISIYQDTHNFRIYDYATYRANADAIVINSAPLIDWESMTDFHLATDSEKQQLFDALAKKGKRWNAETKVIEDLPKPHEFKPFDKVLVRDEEYNKWHINFFEGYDEGQSYPYKCMLAYYRYCIPYEGNEHLVGTKDTPKENITVTIASSDDSGEPQFKVFDGNIALT